MLSSLFAMAAAFAPVADKEAPRLYEMRIYYAAPGKLDALHARFRDHTMKLFEKHGMVNHGYWVPAEKNPDSKLVYLLSYPDDAARKKSWADFVADPAWKSAFAASEKDGKLVAKAESHYLALTDYSPVVKPSTDGPGRAFELRTYTTTPGNLPGLNSRFRDHTVKLFEKHGMTNLWYFTPAKGQKGEENTLVYFLAHKSKEARDASFDSFRKDPVWVGAREASEKKAGGSLTTPDGVKFEMLVPTDYSPIK